MKTPFCCTHEYGARLSRKGMRGAGLGLLLLLLADGRATAGGAVSSCTQADLMAALNGGGLVTFGCPGPLLLTNTITVTRNTTLDGGGLGVTISGSSVVRLFNVSTGATLTLVGLNLVNGRSPAGGCISNSGTLNVTNCQFTGNEALGLNGTNGLTGSPGRDAAGGAIWNNGVLHVSGSIFSRNTARGGDGGNGSNAGGDGGAGGDAGAARGGAIFSQGLIQVATTQFQDNSATGGKGGSAGDGAHESNPRISAHPGGHGGQGAPAAGGAIYSETNSVAVSRSFFGGNKVSGGAGGSGGHGNSGFQTIGASGGVGGSGGSASGGAVHGEAGRVSLTNCTFAANEVLGGDGNRDGNGGACTGGRSTGADAGGGGSGGDGVGGGVFGGISATNTLVNDTLSGNSAKGGVKGTNGVPSTSCVGLADGIAVNPGTNGLSAGGAVCSSTSSNAVGFALKNTILADSLSGSNSFGQVFDAGNNLSSDASGHFTDRSSLNATDPKLSPLAANGGPTPTFALLAGSPAIDAGDNAACPPTDQRGVPRPQGINCDMGAFEYTGAAALLRGGGGLRLIFSAVPNRPCVLQSSSDLHLWQEQPATMTMTNGKVMFDVTAGTSASARFFRTMMSP